MFLLFRFVGLVFVCGEGVGLFVVGREQWRGAFYRRGETVGPYPGTLVS